MSKHIFSIFICMSFILCSGCDTLSYYQDQKQFNGASNHYSRSHPPVRRTIGDIEVDVTINRFNYTIGAKIEIKNMSATTYTLNSDRISIQSAVDGTLLKAISLYLISGKKQTKVRKLDQQCTIKPKSELRLFKTWDAGPIMSSWSHILDRPEQHRLILSIDGLFMHNKKLSTIKIFVIDK